MTDKRNDMFQFKIDLEYVPDIELLIEIPEELHCRISDLVGNDRMDRYEFCFHFSTYIKEHFSEVDHQIIQKIDEWKQNHYGLKTPDHLLYRYGLVSPWFEEV